MNRAFVAGVLRWKPTIARAIKKRNGVKPFAKGIMAERGGAAKSSRTMTFFRSNLSANPPPGICVRRNVTPNQEAKKHPTPSFSTPTTSERYIDRVGLTTPRLKATRSWLRE